MIPSLDRCRVAGPVAVLAVLGVFAAPASAQRYTATQSATPQGDTVTLADRVTDTVVVVVPSRGNMATEMRVKGHHVLEARGIPFMGPWANRLDEPAFYANGRRHPST